MSKEQNFKPGVYLNLFKGRGDLVVIKNAESLPEGNVSIADLNCVVEFKLTNGELHVSILDLEYLGPL